MYLTHIYQLLLNGMYYVNSANYVPLNGIKYTSYATSDISSQSSLTLTPSRVTDYTATRTTDYTATDRNGNYCPDNRLVES